MTESGTFLTSANADASLSYGSYSLFLTVVSLGLLGQLGLVHVVLALGHGCPDVDAVVSLVAALVDGSESLVVVLAGDELLLVTAHVVDELREKDGEGEGGGERERESSREKNAAEKQGCQSEFVNKPSGARNAYYCPPFSLNAKKVNHILSSQELIVTNKIYCHR